MRIGHGYDVHRFVENRNLILGGCNINYKMGLLGHSDADVLTHAIMDALLGAAALCDIGKWFPDNDKTFENADSIQLLKMVCEKISEKGFHIGNIDATVIAQQPKLAPFIETMKNNIANACKISRDQINIKATTEEGLGFTGNLQGISAHAVCILE